MRGSRERRVALCLEVGAERGFALGREVGGPGGERWAEQAPATNVCEPFGTFRPRLGVGGMGQSRRGDWKDLGR